jgi:hypothetical protein
LSKATAVVLCASLAACSEILGIDPVQQAPCGSACEGELPDSGAVPDATDAGAAGDVFTPEGDTSTSDASDADASDGYIPPGQPVPPGPYQSWAHWPMPNPDAAIAPDSATPLPHPMAYDAGLDGAVLDTVTGLLWESSGNNGPMGVDGAWGHCQTLGAGWRVPTRIELVSLVDFTRAAPAVGAPFASSTQAAYYWTSSVVSIDAGADAAATYWSVSFSDGLVSNQLVDGTVNPQWVRCVAGGLGP